MFKNVQIAFYSVAVLWIVHVANLLIPFDLRLFGLRPRCLECLWGIALSPFLHGNFRHLIANSTALFALMLISLTYSKKITAIALLIILFVGGGMVWVFGRSNTLHIGASGIIFGLIGFLICIGFFRHEWKALLYSLIVFLFYGGTLLSLLMYVPGVSWMGHFFGFVSGILAAWCLKTANL